MVGQLNKETKKKRKFDEDLDEGNKRFKNNASEDEESINTRDEYEISTKETFKNRLKKSVITLVSQKPDKLCPKMGKLGILGIGFDQRKMLK